ncbi:MAG TPA: glycosyltransferase family 4 protein [Tepidisphaeraceae bacterium]|nr:glycosyltransferase family 4 protein [Tepidisphaeraceae bacterium]
MRITIVTGAFLPLPPAACGAVEVLWNELAHEFAAQGHEVTMVSRAWPDQMANETIGRVRYIRRSGFKRTNNLKINLLKDAVFSARIMLSVPKSDICVTNVFWLPALLASMRRSAGQIVVNVARAPKGQMGLYRFVSRLACTSSAVAEQVIAQTPSVAGITKVLPNPINTKAFVPPAAPRQWNGKRYVVYTGRIHPEKGVHVLVEAFGRLPNRPNDLTLRIVGPSETSRGGGGEEYLAKLKSLGQNLPVEFLPAIADRNQLAHLLQNAHYYCYPSLAEKGESFGVAPLEAMATGLAPIVSDLACFRDFVQHGVNGVIFDHRNDPVESLTRALTGQLADTNDIIRMGQAAAETALQFSNSRVAQMFLEDFELLLEARTQKTRERAL